MLKPTRNLLLNTVLFAAFSATLFTACNKGGSESTQKPASQPALSAAPDAPATQPPAVAAPESASAPAPVPTAPITPPPAPTGPRMDFSLPIQPVSNMAPLFTAYRGKAVLLFYFGPTCPHCQKAFPEVQAFSDEIRSRGVETVAIANSRSNPQEIQDFMNTYRVRVPMYWDTDRKFGAAFDVKTLPSIYLVNKDGGIFRQDTYNGKSTLDSLRARI